MQNKQPLISVIILGYNKCGFTKICLESMAQTSYKNLEFWLINNGSEDETLQVFEEFKNSVSDRWQVNIKNFDKNEGAVAGRNYALDRFNGEYVLFIDNDVTNTDKEWLNALVNRMEEDKSIGAICPKLVFPKPENMIQCAGCAVSRSGRIQFMGRGEPEDSPRYNTEYECQCTISACLLIRGETAKDIGLLDRDFDPVQFEDIDYCYRIREKGQKIIYYPHVKMLHYENVTTDGSNDINYRYITIKNGLKFKEKWRHRFEHENGPLEKDVKWLEIPKYDIKDLFPPEEDNSKPEDSASVTELLEDDKIDEESEEQLLIEKEIGGNNEALARSISSTKNPLIIDATFLRVIACLFIIGLSAFLICYNEELQTENWHNIKKIIIDDSAKITNLPIPGSSIIEEEKSAINRSENEIVLSGEEKNIPAEKPKPAATPSAPIASTPVSQPNPKPAAPQPKPAMTSNTESKIIPQANIIVYRNSGILLTRSHATIAHVFRNIAAGRTPGKKGAIDDEKSPIGKYRVIAKSNTTADGPVLLLNYPNSEDAQNALKNGVISPADCEAIKTADKNGTVPPQDTPLGGGIKIMSKEFCGEETSGSFGISKEQMEKLYSGIPLGTSVWIVEK